MHVESEAPPMSAAANVHAGAHSPEAVITAARAVWERSLEAPEEAELALQKLLVEPVAEVNPYARALLLRVQCYLEMWRGDTHAAYTSGAEAERLLEAAAGDIGGESEELILDKATVAYLLSTVALMIGAFDQAFHYGSESLRHAEAAGEVRWIAWAHDALSSFYLETGELDAAKTETCAALDRFDAVGYDVGRIRMVGRLGDLAIKQGDWEDAIGYYRRGLDIPGLPARMVHFTRIGYASALVELDRLDEAQRVFDVAFAEEHGDDVGSATLRFGYAALLRKQNRPHDAIEQLLNAWDKASKQDLAADRDRICRELSEIYEEEGDVGAALAWARRYHQTHEDLFEQERARDLRNAHVRIAVERSRAEADWERRKNTEIEELLHNILPSSVARELRETGRAEPIFHPEVTVLFADFVNFTAHAATLSPTELVDTLNRAFTRFDGVIEYHGLEKLKTMGDAYMAVSGAPDPKEDHAVRLARAAHDMIDVAADLRVELDTDEAWHVRIGMHSGPIVAGVVGQIKFAYDIWGSTVNLASRLEEASLPDQITVSARTAELLKGTFEVSYSGTVELKGAGRQDIYLVGDAL
ncbi:MAG: adenylate/guanylate cyclase domain-containing protein [Spirochaetales bacterium]|nr:adenylate/guanylate cyclase domain-containing protein [Spirochaetales bacterium]